MIGEFTIDLYPMVDHCPICYRDLNKVKTTFRNAKYTGLGSFRVRQIYLHCPIHPYLSSIEKDTVLLRKYGPQLPEHNRGKSPYGMDVVCFVGIEKFLYCKRREQIQELAQERYGLSLSDGTVTNLGVEFLLRLAYYHKQHFSRLVEDIHKGGGYILGIDGTSDGESDKLFLGMDLIRDWVLISEDLPAESSEFISPLLKALNLQIGFPLAVVCDKGSGIERALKDEMPDEVPIRNCDYHFLKNVGSALMEDTYRLFQKAMVDSGIQAYLTRLRKDLYLDAKNNGIDIAAYAKMVRDKQVPKDAPSSHVIMSETYDCISWILRFSEDNNGLRFPFSLPDLNLYLRCKHGYDAIVATRKMATADMKSPKYLRELELKLTGILSGHTTTKTGSGRNITIEWLSTDLLNRYALFEQLRTILNIPKEKGDIPRDKLLINSNRRISEMRSKLETFRQGLQAITGDAAQTREQVIVSYLDKYWPHIVMNNIEIEVNDETRILEIPRTSGGNDTCFGEIKSDIRKRIGKMDTGRELNRYGPYLGLVQNLKKEDYVRIMFGSWDLIPQKLSKTPKWIMVGEKKKYQDFVKNYDITNTGLRSSSVSIEEIMEGISIYHECVEEKRWMETFCPPDVCERAPNGLLTL